MHPFLIAAAAIAAVAVSPPATMTAHLQSVRTIARFADLPPAIKAGHFTIDGAKADGWEMAEPGGAFDPTDVPVPGALGRRLIWAACDADVCIIHYERGGIAHFYEMLALARGGNGWSAIWNARGAKPFANLEALKVFLKHPTPDGHWDQQWVKGDY